MKKFENTIAYSIDLESKKLEIMEYSGEFLLGDMKYYKAKHPLDLDTYDYKVFMSEKAAEKWLKKYKETLKKLPKLKDKKFEPGPTLIYKRRYLAQTAMGEKMMTERKYGKDWKPGTIVKLYDQTYYILVKLKRIKKLEEDRFRYEFSLVKGQR